MAFKPFKKIRIRQGQPPTAEEFNSVQDNIDQAVSQLLGKDVLDQQLLKNVVLLPGITNKVSHGLGRRLAGYLVVRNHGSYAILTDTQDTNPAPDLLLYLTTPALVTVDLLVF